MPRLTITLPTNLYNKVLLLARENDDSMSYTIARMTEEGLSINEKKKNNKDSKSIHDVEEHCLKLIIQMNAIIKTMAAKNLDFTQEDFDKLRDSSILKFNDLMGIPVEVL